MDKEWITLRRDLIEPCFTCPICDSLLKEATSNTECIHTFCKECISFMIEDEEIESCPVCETDWSSNPEQKLRPDFNWQCLRDIVFPSDEETVKAAEVVTSEQSATKGKEKEKSPSPLAVSSPSVAKDHEASRVSIKKEEELLEDGSTSNVDTANKSSENTEETAENISLLSLTSSDMQALSPFEDNQSTDQGEKNGADAEPQEATLSTLKGMKGKESGSQVQEAKSKGKKGKRKLKDKKISTDNYDSSDTAESNQLEPCQKKPPVSGGSSRSPDQEVLDASNTKLLRDDSIWFSLIADENQEGAPLPQIPSPYLRIKDGGITVSFIQKYLKQKLGLESEDEIEIKCMGNSVQPTIVVRDLLRSWMDTMFAGQRITATMGSSAKDFIMVLTYGRKILN